eukprot:GSA120T00021114001.1
MLMSIQATSSQQTGPHGLHGHEGKQEQAFAHAVAHVHNGAVVGADKVDTAWNAGFHHAFNNMIHAAGLPDPDTVPDVSGHMINSDADVENYYNHLSGTQKDAFETLLNDYLDNVDSEKYNVDPDVDVDPGHLTHDDTDQWDQWKGAWPLSDTSTRKTIFDAAVEHVKDGNVKPGAASNLYVPSSHPFTTAFDNMIHEAGLPDPGLDTMHVDGSGSRHMQISSDDDVENYYKHLSGTQKDAFETLLSDYLDNVDSEKY